MSPNCSAKNEGLIIHVPLTTLPGEAVSRITTRDAERFWSKTEPSASGCRLWRGSINPVSGYGQFSNGRIRRHGRMVSWPVYAHRFAWLLTHGAIPLGQMVLHACDVPACVNPDHLFLGTHRDNMADAARKGRLHVVRPKGQKLTDAQVSQIRALAASGVPQVDIARTFLVSKTWVSLFLKGKRGQYRRAS